MPEEQPPDTEQGTKGGASRDKHSRARRRLLKALAAGGGAVAATQVVPARWVKPVVDTVVVPAHAQATGPSMTVQLSLIQDAVDDAGSDTFNAPGAFVADFGLIANSDDLDVTGQATLINPPVPGQSVTLTLALAGGVDAGIGTNPQVVASNPGTGVAAFGAMNIDESDDGGVQNLAAGFTATFSSPGVPPRVITITFA